MFNIFVLSCIGSAACLALYYVFGSLHFGSVNRFEAQKWSRCLQKTAAVGKACATVAALSGLILAGEIIAVIVYTRGLQ